MNYKNIMDNATLNMLAREILVTINLKWNANYEAADLDLRAHFQVDGGPLWVAQAGRLESDEMATPEQALRGLLDRARKIKLK